ncbi:LuxR C-terminal-related transcriptional regulator [Streptomyces sp. NPDC057474]|uniref:LuxR family transcriptional regulator n=1 Tax=Streptomyces sp. NPDC057474 TaxID=3346144 RepID=UPI003697212C
MPVTGVDPAGRPGRPRQGGPTVKNGASTDLLVRGKARGDVEALVLELITRLSGSEGRVLLDLEVDDVRCVVIRSDRAGPMALLSPREREIARMVACGHPNKTIASVLEISTWTVASHLRRIFVKLQVSSRAAMVNRLVTGDPQPRPVPGPEAVDLAAAPFLSQG